MDIFKLFDELKYFKMDFNQPLVEDDFAEIKKLIDQSFDIDKKPSLKKPNILEGEITFDYDHSQTYARLSINTKDQQGLMAYIITIFDKYGIDVSSAKIQTIKNRARNLFLMEKKAKLYDNIKLVIQELYESE